MARLVFCREYLKLVARLSLFSSMLLFSTPLWAATRGNIYTIAGTGVFGFNGDTIQATTAKLASPSGVFVDSSGNIFIADQINHRIRRIDAATGLISTVAGTGVAGYNSDGISATSAQLNYPAGVFVDSSGNIFIADEYNHRIRKVTAGTGVISTVAGTGTGGYNADGISATTSDLYRPFDIFVATSGDIYIADQYNHRIRKVTVGTGIISTVAGTGVGGYNTDGVAATTAQISQPHHVFSDSSGNLFIADTGNHRIRKVAAGTGLISTVVGTGTGGYNADGITATSAQLSDPTGVYVAGTGEIFIADLSNNRVRKVASGTGIISTVAGTGVSGYNGDDLPATGAKLYSPCKVFVDSSGNIYIADLANYRIRKVSGVGVDPGDPSNLEKGDLIIHGNLIDFRSYSPARIFIKGGADKKVNIDICDRGGKVAARLGEVLLDSSGSGSVLFDGTNGSGKRLLSGMYFAVASGDVSAFAPIIVRGGRE